MREFYTEDATVQYGDNALLEGRDNLLNMFKNLFERFGQMQHEIGHTDVLSDRIYQYVQVSHKVKDGTETIKIPALAVVHKTPAEQKMRRFEVFAGTSSLLTKMNS